MTFSGVEGNLKLIALVVLNFWFFFSVEIFFNLSQVCNLVRILLVTLNQVVTPCVHFSVLINIYWLPM